MNPREVTPTPRCQVLAGGRSTAGSILQLPRVVCGLLLPGLDPEPPSHRLPSLCRPCPLSKPRWQWLHENETRKEFRALGAELGTAAETTLE